MEQIDQLWNRLELVGNNECICVENNLRANYQKLLSLNYDNQIQIQLSQMHSGIVRKNSKTIAPVSDKTIN